MDVKTPGFITPNGLDAVCATRWTGEPSHGTTAADLAAILATVYGISQAGYVSGNHPDHRTNLYRLFRPTFLLLRKPQRAPDHDGWGVDRQNRIHGRGGIFLRGGLKVGTEPSLSPFWEADGRPTRPTNGKTPRSIFEYGKEHYHYRDVFEAGSYGRAVGKGPGRGAVSSRLPKENSTLTCFWSDGEP